MDLFFAAEIKDDGTHDDAAGLIEGEVDDGKRDMEKVVAGDDRKEDGLADKITGENPFKVEVGLLNGLEMREKDHAEQAGDKPFEHQGQVGSGMKSSSEPVGEEGDKQDKDQADAAVDNQRRGSYFRLVGNVVGGSHESDVGVLEQAAFCQLKDGSDGKEEGPGAHLWF